jgi:hypothetical protein
MGIPILGGILRRLESLYTFRSGGASAPSEFEVDLPIQPVHDVGPMAGLGASIGPNGGFWLSAVQITHTVTGEINFNHSLRYDFTASTFPPIPSYDSENQWAWVYNVWVGCSDNSDLQYARMAILQSDFSLGSHGGVVPTVGHQVIFDGDTMLFDTVENEMQGRPMFPIPMLLGPNADSTTDAFLVVSSRADNAGTLINTFTNLFWVGPKGIHPPMVS